MDIIGTTVDLIKAIRCQLESFKANSERAQTLANRVDALSAPLNLLAESQAKTYGLNESMSKALVELKDLLQDIQRFIMHYEPGSFFRSIVNFLSALEHEGTLGAFCERLDSACIVLNLVHDIDRARWQEELAEATRADVVRMKSQLEALVKEVGCRSSDIQAVAVAMERQLQAQGIALSESKALVGEVRDTLTRSAQLQDEQLRELKTIKEEIRELMRAAMDKQPAGSDGASDGAAAPASVTAATVAAAALASSEDRIPPIDEGSLDTTACALLGGGTFGLVHRVRYGGVLRALKTVDPSDGVKVEALAREMRVHFLLSRRVSHAVVRCLCGDPATGRLVMELAQCSLDTLIHTRDDAPTHLLRHFDTLTVLDCMCQAASALSCVHTADIAHCDVKPANMLVFEGFRVKLCDFGFARPLGCPKSNAGYADPTPESPYVAPELYGLQDDSTTAFTEKSDMYAFSMCINEGLSRATPYCDRGWGPEEAIAKLRQEVCAGHRPVMLEWKLPHNVAARMQALVVAGWAGDAARRPSAEEVLLALEDARSLLRDTVAASSANAPGPGVPRVAGTGDGVSEPEIAALAAWLEQAAAVREEHATKYAENLSAQRLHTVERLVSALCDSPDGGQLASADIHPEDEKQIRRALLPQIAEEKRLREVAAWIDENLPGKGRELAQRLRRAEIFSLETLWKQLHVDHKWLSVQKIASEQAEVTLREALNAKFTAPAPPSRPLTPRSSRITSWAGSPGRVIMRSEEPLLAVSPLSPPIGFMGTMVMNSGMMQPMGIGNHLCMGMLGAAISGGTTQHHQQASQTTSSSSSSSNVNTNSTSSTQEQHDMTTAGLLEGHRGGGMMGGVMSLQMPLQLPMQMPLQIPMQMPLPIPMQMPLPIPMQMLMQQVPMAVSGLQVGTAQTQVQQAVSSATTSSSSSSSSSLSSSSSTSSSSSSNATSTGMSMGAGNGMAGMGMGMGAATG